MKIDQNGNASTDKTGIDFDPGFAKRKTKKEFVEAHEHHKDDTNLEKAWETLRKESEEEKAEIPVEEQKPKVKEAKGASEAQ